MIAKQAAVASRFGVQLVAYEADSTLPLQARQWMTNACVGCLRMRTATRMGNCTAPYANWRKEGGGIYTFYNSMGAYNKWGSWGLIERESLQASSPRGRRSEAIGT